MWSTWEIINHLQEFSEIKSPYISQCVPGGGGGVVGVNIDRCIMHYNVIHLLTEVYISMR